MPKTTDCQCLLLFMTILFLTGLLSSCQFFAPHHEKHNFYHMDTAVEVTVVTWSGSNALKPLWNAIDSLLGFWDEHYSQSNTKSEIYNIKHRSSQMVPISPVLGNMIATALAWGDTTRGRFDLTILPVKELGGWAKPIPYTPFPPTIRLRQRCAG